MPVLGEGHKIPTGSRVWLDGASVSATRISKRASRNASVATGRASCLVPILFSDPLQLALELVQPGFDSACLRDGPLELGDFGLQRAARRHHILQVVRIYDRREADHHHGDLAAVHRVLAPGEHQVPVVDPGVGGSRKNIALRTKDGRFLVGPDNGVLSIAFSSRGVEEAVEIQNTDLTLLHLAKSRTFHGKDVFAPAAAHLLRGVPLREFGREISESDLAKISISAQSTERSRAGFLVDIDGFGSIRTNVPNHLPEEVVGKVVRFSISGPEGGKEGAARVVRTFSEAGRGEPGYVLSSTGCLDLAINLGSASTHLGISPDQIRVDGTLRPQNRIELDLGIC